MSDPNGGPDKDQPDKQSGSDPFKIEYLKNAHDRSPMGVLAVDGQGIISYANPAALTFSGLDEKGVIGQSIFSLYEDISEEKLNETKLQGHEEFLDQEFKTKTGPGPRWVLMSSTVYYSKGDAQTFLFVRDISRLKKKENLFAYLNQAATALAKTRDTESALAQIAQLVVPKFANWFTVDRLNGNKLELLVLKHEDPARIKWARKYRQTYPPDLNASSGPAVIIKTGKPGFVPVITEEMLDAIVVDPVQRREVKKIGMHSVMMVPVYVTDKIIGIANFISSVPGRYFDESDLDFAEHFANLIGLALENARLNEEAAKEISLRKESEELFRFLTDAIPHKLWTSGPDGRATYYNRQWHDYTGIGGFEALRERIWEIIHPEDRAIAAVAWPRAVKEGEPMEMEHRLMGQGGLYRWHLSRFTPFKNPGGEIILWVGTSTDIHEQKVSVMGQSALNEELSAANEELVAVNEEIASVNEELSSANEELAATNEELTETQASLQRSEKLFRSIALNIPKSLIIVIDKSHRYLTIEGDIMEKLGYDRKDYEGKHPAEISPERYEASRHLYERVLAGEKFSIERKAETGESYMVHFVPLNNEHGEVDAGLIIALDITEIKKAEEYSIKLAAIVESSDDAIISKTLESEITSWNPAAERMFGYTSEEMIGETIYRIIPPDRLDEEPGIISRLRKGERLKHFETKRLTKDGGLLDVSLTISPLRDAQGNITGISKIVRDITERKLQEQKKNDFIGMVSHELKTPLTSLNALVQVAGIKLKNSNDAFLAGAMERANLQVKKMTGMINGFLNISRLEAGKMLIDQQVFELDGLLREIADETRLIVNTHTIELTVSVPVSVFADRDKIGSVVSNLVSNAVKYSPRGSKVALGYQADQEKVIVSIRDEGIGIDRQDLDKVFDRYYRVETNDTRHISGFGIGLYLSAEIIRQHGCSIWAESGNGSIFSFTLPLAGNQ